MNSAHGLPAADGCVWETEGVRAASGTTRATQTTGNGGSLIDQLTVVAIGYAALVTVGALVVCITRRPRPQLVDSSVWILEALLLVRLAAGVGSMMNGHRPAEFAAHVGYLVASVCVLPIAMGSITEDKSPWSSGVVTVAGLAVTVIAVRLQMTWGVHA
jgi:hypothetical protein